MARGGPSATGQRERKKKNEIINKEKKRKERGRREDKGTGGQWEN